MIIEQIDNSKVLIVLGSTDMRDFSLEYRTLSFSDPHSRMILTRLLTLACVKTGMDTEDKKLIVEALPHSEGCLILLTLAPKGRRRTYRIKKPDKNLCCVFRDSEALISAGVALKGKNLLPQNSVYLYRGKYCLVIDNRPVSLGALCLLEEFSTPFVCTKTAIARIKENGKKLSAGNGIQTIGNYF